MSKEKFILQEEINRMKKLATYDKSKTLTENKEFINEQTTYYYDSNGYLKILNGPLAIPQGGTAASKVYPTLKPSEYPPSTVIGVKAPQTDIKTTKFPCFTSTSVPYDYNPKRGDTVGNYAPAKMDFLRIFQDNAIIVAWENNTIKQYVRNGNTAGPETKKGTWKCNANNSGVDVVMTDSVAKKQTQKSPLKVAGQSTPNTKESSIGVNYQYEYPNDKKYSYGVKDKKWFGKNLANGKEFDLSTITTTITNLNRQFPNAMVEEPPQAAKPEAPNPETATPGVVQEPTK
jgi:hypothetical protein